MKRNDQLVNRFGLAALALCVLLTVAAGVIDERSGMDIRYRNGTTLTFDTSVRFLDEDGAWSFGSVHLRRLAQIRSGSASNLTANLVTNSFGITYAAAPQIAISCGTNASVISKTTTNAVFWAAATNQVIDWITTSGQ